ncbi:Putative Regulator of ribosome biosynthesis [[Torrubiella] hemipterigena]|uniref:Ribosome biogenesis regulatory protein n=1 Tax=[Torrubiella] hemipterigena TaxID=1531966 RepID=A0A0A1TTH3_9HYPO|nr:Putative Regulator of ribosome biosynthesis [[Torrubiella] hemipterigena]
MSLPTTPKLPVAVEKPTAYTFDLGHLMAEDPNSISLDKSDLEQSLAEVARDGAQVLINQLLTTCALTSTTDGVLLTLPQPTTRLPREKPIPQVKPPTKWERFAAKKGIKAKTREARRNLAYDETTGEWTRKWGYKGLNKKGEDAPIMEVDMEAERTRKEGTSIRGDGRRERKEKIKRNERKMRKNQRDAAESRK